MRQHECYQSNIMRQPTLHCVTFAKLQPHICGIRCFAKYAISAPKTLDLTSDVAGRSAQPIHTDRARRNNPVLMEYLGCDAKLIPGTLKPFQKSCHHRSCRISRIGGRNQNTSIQQKYHGCSITRRTTLLVASLRQERAVRKHIRMLPPYDEVALRHSDCLIAYRPQRSQRLGEAVGSPANQPVRQER